MTTKHISFIVAATVLLGIISWAIYSGLLSNRGPAPAASTTPSIATTTTTATSTDIAGGARPNYTVAGSTTSPSGANTDVPPSLDRPIIVPSSFSERDATVVKVRIATLIGAIRENPSNGALWANLGMELKGIEDYEGAKEAYEYALKRMPGNVVVADSLGVIYGDYLKDYKAAERYFRLAVSLDSSTNFEYLRLFDLYRYALKDIAKARAVLEEGLRVLPNDPAMKTLLETMD